MTDKQSNEPDFGDFVGQIAEESWRERLGVDALRAENEAIKTAHQEYLDRLNGEIKQMGDANLNLHNTIDVLEDKNEALEAENAALREVLEYTRQQLERIPTPISPHQTRFVTETIDAIYALVRDELEKN